MLVFSNMKRHFATVCLILRSDSNGDRISMFKKDFKPEPGHELFKKPPPIHTKLNVAKRPAGWCKSDCLTAKQWRVLINWCTDNYELLNGKTRGQMIQAAQEGLFKKNVKIVSQVQGVPKKSLNVVTLPEAWEQACRAVQS
jgi:hypothetical protein